MLGVRHVYPLKAESGFSILFALPLSSYSLPTFLHFLHFINIPLLTIILKTDIMNSPASQEAQFSGSPGIAGARMEKEGCWMGDTCSSLPIFPLHPGNSEGTNFIVYEV